jgi:enoyl-CoA hydratase/carnithine racemase
VACGAPAALGSLLQAVASISVPVIAAVEGRAHSNPEIALMADVIIAGAGATFSRSAHGSLSDIDLVRSLWRHRIGSDRADAFLIHPLPLSADRAWAWGCVDEVTATGGALARARAVARLYLAAPEATRRRLRSHVIEPLKQLMSPAWRTDWRASSGRDISPAPASAA